jgi:hypothetical protein
VEKCGYMFTEGYRINFMAGNTLFFAEFWVSRKPDESKPDICCPLNPPYTGKLSVLTITEMKSKTFVCLPLVYIMQLLIALI